MRSLLIALAGLGALLEPAIAQTANAALTTANNPEEGEYLVDAAGMALYTFKADTQGIGGASAKSACNDSECVGVWPPLIVTGVPVADHKVDQSLLGTITRDDGTVQVTYNGWPLYYYFEDYALGDINGDDIESFGEDWYLIGPHGDRPGKEARDERDED